MSQEQLVNDVQAWVENHHDEMLADLQAILRIPSSESAAEPNAPFGSENRRALDYMLERANDSGMKTTDLEGYAGYAEFGSGEKMVMTLGHLDVVPVGPGWKHDPFGAEIEDGWLYARGAIDDKGPTIAMWYAARALQASAPQLDVRIRSVFGCNEESGFKCVERYLQTEEIPTLGVAPDADWPCIHGEKGICNFVVDVPLPNGEMTLLQLNGGQRPNIVIDDCSAMIEVTDSALDHVQTKVAESWDKNISFSWNGHRLEVHASGKAAHGSTPFAGDNAATRVLRFLKEAAPLSQESEYKELFYFGHVGGNGLGIAGSDDVSGPLTLNLGIAETANGRLNLTLNVRYPVTFSGHQLQSLCEKHLLNLKCGATLKSFEDSPPLYFPSDHPLVRAVVDTYHLETGELLMPKTMGGGTYARAIPNCIAIGTGWTGDGQAHETDERIRVEHLFKMARIYAHLLVKIAATARQSK
ncbi:Sapep family Mn(2+)-dependent dipeptidase [Kamptonema cortianum]|nr:Sapep family Mn(2+)-dependent dipeptidase [Geitlerinema splendidum]MDK3155230.1 Sapep family Mn(2+)-dependent dipeptidase [Kamptonema cortianum]